MKVISIAGLALVAATAPAHAQADARSFTFMFENDTFNKSDSSYTNGIRLSWSSMRYSKKLQPFTNSNLVSFLDRAFDVVGADAIRPTALGLIPRATPTRKCQWNSDRANLYGNRACTVATTSLAQLQYTPDTLASTTAVTHSRPYAGFLHATAGVTTLSAEKTGWIAFSEVSNQLVVGVTGPPSLAEDGQAFAHWTMSTGAHRPLGWDTQLRFAPQVGLINDIVIRPRGWEHCVGDDACDGTVDEQRRADLSLHSELVTATQMLRYSLGTVVRLGHDYPDAVGALRIPVSKGRGSGGSFWWYVFGNLEGRYVPYNMFISGGWRDGGVDGWRNVKQITARSLVAESAIGLSFGTRDASGRIEMTSRTPEYDVIGRDRPRFMHGFMTFMLSIHPRPD
jgi:lipid A 3-O-deacylase